jgi:hypothetical protein
MARLSDVQKTLRLTSFNVSALDVRPLAAKTLVKFAGSLTGRDFRVIAQVAPSVLFDIVPKTFFPAWFALGVGTPGRQPRCTLSPSFDHSIISYTHIDQNRAGNPPLFKLHRSVDATLV